MPPTSVLFCTPCSIRSTFLSLQHGRHHLFLHPGRLHPGRLHPCRLPPARSLPQTAASSTIRPSATAQSNSSKAKIDTLVDTMSSSSPASLNVGARLSALRAEMTRLGLHAFIVPSTDAHNSEYAAPCFARRAYISGFSGSAGTVVVTADAAMLWTDGRYFLQAEKELDASCWRLMRAGLPDTPTIPDFLANELPEGSVIGIDAFLHSVDSADALRQALHKSGSSLKMLDDGKNPVDAVWADDRPGLPQGLIRAHGMEYAGKCASDKIKMLREKMEEVGACAVLLSMLDETAWLYNIRGSDIPHCPVVMSYALVTNGKASFFVDESKVPRDVRDKLAEEGVSVESYEGVLAAVKEAAAEGAVWIDAASTSAAVAAAAGDGAIKEPTPVALAKAIKNEAELKGMREAHVRDGVALSSFLCWLERYVRDGNFLTEVEAAERLEGFRSKQNGFITTSFETISGSGANGAVIHYRAEKETCATITGDEVFLLDSGGQYVDGTTDVTRTMHLKGSGSEHQKMCFTRVLKGHIALDSAVFPEGTTGLMVDALARLPLWKVGLDYRHGTGHGVGAGLNVHEGPQSISSRAGANKTGLQAGMVVSNEPGYYEDGAFGIRIENLLIVGPKKTQFQFGGRRYLGFEPLTWVPLDAGMIDVTLLDGAEVAWVDDYHNRVWQTLSPSIGNEGEDAAVRQWLWQKTRPLLSP